MTDTPDAAPAVADTPTPRLSPFAKERLNHRQALFAREYLVDFDPKEAYKRAGYDVAADETAARNGSRLLQHAGVLDEIDRLQREQVQRLGMDSDWVIIGFKRVYLVAVERGEMGAALKALENIGRMLGVYEKDNFQKKPVTVTLEALKAELKEKGIDFDKITARSKN